LKVAPRGRLAHSPRHPEVRDFKPTRPVRRRSPAETVRGWKAFADPHFLLNYRKMRLKNNCMSAHNLLFASGMNDYLYGG